ncbi:iron-sulfur cluster insertion protein ErpA [Pleionea litopenaei]|uniref:Iron-sulfur cluster insertion protein ErpA n=1 Tax=Pleionea litopenaei TaxID=3070815 RepID=A0AA51RX90_9GAMM|nr:iron-sulfur cluster insertion protein ErpA [Pleionea sp. HL-JVS1]WMS89128.1 iron-sulfur cluster insertion protein ErpA [Pleionea sp. HL-JVS1]
MSEPTDSINTSNADVSEAIPALLEVTSAASSKVKELLEDEDNQSLRLRVYVTGGGCSGFQYGFKFDDYLSDEDTQIEKDGMVLLVDPLSIQYLAGSTVDYIDGLEGARFVVNNPNATATCGCGASFSI